MSVYDITMPLKIASLLFAFIQILFMSADHFRFDVSVKPRWQWEFTVLINSFLKCNGGRMIFVLVCSERGMSQVFLALNVTNQV